MAEDRTLVLWRHGRTEWNDTGRAQGHTDIELDAVGRAQARAAASVLAGLAPTRLWTSDLARARQTAAALSELTGLVAEQDPRLREYDVGERAGLTLEEFSTSFPEEYAAWVGGDESHRVAGAETTSEVRERIVPAVRECWEALGPGETGVVVTHGAALRVAVTGLLGWPDSMDTSLGGLANCGWLRIHQHPRWGLQLASYNETVAVTPAAGGDFVSDRPSG